MSTTLVHLRYSMEWKSVFQRDAFDVPVIALMKGIPPKNIVVYCNH